MKKPEANDPAAAEEQFKRRLLNLGLLTKITPPAPADSLPRDRQPASVIGNAVSQTVIEERR